MLAEEGLLKGNTVSVDGTTLEANAALRSIVRRDSGQGYDDFLKDLAKESGIETPTREQLARLDRKRKKKGNNDDWKNPHDPDAQITKMKDGRTHLAHKAEHAVDLETGAVLAVTLQPATAGDTNTLPETLAQCGEHIREVAADIDNKAGQMNPEGPAELVLDKGYHSNDVLVILKEVEVRSYCSEPDRGRRNHLVLAVCLIGLTSCGSNPKRLYRPGKQVLRRAQAGGCGAAIPKGAAKGPKFRGSLVPPGARRVGAGQSRGRIPGIAARGRLDAGKHS
jgi:hypothetical protein